MFLITVFVAVAALLVPGRECSSLKGREISIGHCPDFKPMHDFVLSSYLGVWYEQQRYDNGYEMDLDCAKAKYTDIGDGNVEFHDSGRLPDGLIAQSIGVGYEIAPGNLFIYFEGHDPVDYFILGTDYENYAAVFNCVQLGEVKYEYAWVFTRHTSVSQDLIDQARQVFADNGVDLSLFQTTHQGDDCTYLP